MWIFDGWMFLGIYGIPYITIVASAFIVVGRFGTFLVGRWQLAAILLPIALYLFLTFVIRDRQGFNWGYANLVMALPGVMAIIMATRSSLAYWICIAITSVTGITAWLLIPVKGLTRLF